jgi:hypothetical protein
MKGKVGTSMMAPGERSRLITSGKVDIIIKAKDILKRREFADAEAIEVCEKVVSYPLLITHGRARLVYGVWMELAKAGRLKGVRQPKPFTPLIPPDSCESLANARKRIA